MRDTIREVERSVGFREYLKRAKLTGQFLEHNAGDTLSFRYPHAERFRCSFDYDDALKCWRLANTELQESGRLSGLSGVAAFAAEDITVYEFLSPSARCIHCLDTIGVPYGDDLRERAFSEVLALYEGRDERFPNIVVDSVRAVDLPVREEFSYLRELYSDVAQTPIRIVTHDVAAMWPFGSVLKGTDLVLTDGGALNFGQDIVHALYHLHEGIPGINGDNCFVREIWAPVPALYALQLSEGRLSRRVRLKPSPHPIHFTDYIFLRAYLGQGFANAAAENTVAHPAYAIIEPAIRLMVSALDRKSAWERNRILSDAVLADRVDELVSCFERRYGKGSFAAIFDTYALYDKRRFALEFVEEDVLDDIMFAGEVLLPTDVPREVVERIWRDETLRTDASSVLGLLGLE